MNDKDEGDLTGWVTIDNKSGATYKDTKLKLVAGDVHRVKAEVEYRDNMLRMAKAEAAGTGSQFKQDEFFEQHIYSLQRLSTIKDNQIKQISLLDAENITVKKELIFKGANFYYYGQYVDQMPKQKVGVFVEFQNKKENNLRIPFLKVPCEFTSATARGASNLSGKTRSTIRPRTKRFE